MQAHLSEMRDLQASRVLQNPQSMIAFLHKYLHKWFVAVINNFMMLQHMQNSRHVP